MLKQQLEHLKETAARKISPENMKKMIQSRAAVENSGILGRVIQPGEKIPDFSLENAQGTPVLLKELRARGPVLISLYRGVW